VDFLNTRYLKIDETGPAENHIWEAEVLLPEWLSRWDVFAVWERERWFSMKEHLTSESILFDVGTESGWLAALISKYIVGGITSMPSFS